ncbi:MAG: class I SAM-dependent methyltransferase [Ignavibacteria bacterium]|nr:class I SAM-dependent methyltransferase [Ignavibacteria bacterium]
MENEFWNSRYREPDYAYGTEPNDYFRKEITLLTPGKLLLPGEGEGRNAVFAAKSGWNVTAVDFSVQAQSKAIKLAKENNVNINYVVSSLEDYQYTGNEYDAIAFIFVHFPPDIREKVHQTAVASLKKGGTILIEAFGKSQIKNQSGGPKDISYLYSIEDFTNDFYGLIIENLSGHQVILKEDPYHKGIADVIRFKVVKP